MTVFDVSVPPNQLTAPVYILGTIPATPNNGSLNVGPGPWDGASPCFFAGNALGTILAVDAPSSFGGSLVDFQRCGRSYFSISFADPSGDILIGDPNAVTQPTFITYFGNAGAVDSQGNIDAGVNVADFQQSKALTKNYAASIARFLRSGSLGGFDYTQPAVKWDDVTASTADILRSQKQGVTVLRLDHLGIFSAKAVSAFGLTGATAASRYVGATASGAPVAGTFAVGDFIVDQTGAFWVCTVAGSPGTWVKVAAGGGGGMTNPMTTTGDLIYSSDNLGTPARLGIGAEDLCLTVAGGLPVWEASPTSVLTTTGDILYASAANVLARLGIGAAYQSLQMNAADTIPAWQPSAASTLTTTGDLLYASAANTLARRAVGTATQWLTGGSTPTWGDVTQIKNGTPLLKILSDGTLETSGGTTPTISALNASLSAAAFEAGSTSSHGNIKLTWTATAYTSGAVLFHLAFPTTYTNQPTVILCFAHYSGDTPMPANNNDAVPKIANLTTSACDVVLGASVAPANTNTGHLAIWIIGS